MFTMRYLSCVNCLLSLVLITVYVTLGDCKNVDNPKSKMQSPPTAPIYFSDTQVLQYLSWDTLLPAIESMMTGVVRNTVVQPARMFMKIPEKDGILLTMPGYVKSDQPNVTEDSMAVKLVTSYRGNQNIGLPSIQAIVLLFNSNNGKVEAIMEGTEITKWRTAGASVVATKHIFRRSGQRGLILAIMGSGAQAYIHAKAFAANFDLKKIIIWNHRPAGAVTLTQKLRDEGIAIAEAEESGAQAVKNADIIVTATYSSVPVVQFSWLEKSDVHINAVGAGQNHHSELDSEIYSKSSIFFDSEASARNELKGLYDAFPHNMRGEVGEYIEGQIHGDAKYNLTVFHSMGMASEDVITAKIIYDAYKKQTL